jgi:hypothetical protein
VWLQFGTSGAGPAVADVPSAIAATRHTDAQTTARELIMIFVNFVFIVVVFSVLSCVVLAFFDLSLLRTHFRPLPVYCPKSEPRLRGKK